MDILNEDDPESMAIRRAAYERAPFAVGRVVVNWSRIEQQIKLGVAAIDMDRNGVDFQIEMDRRFDLRRKLWRKLMLEQSPSGDFQKKVEEVNVAIPRLYGIRNNVAHNLFGIETLRDGSARYHCQWFEDAYKSRLKIEEFQALSREEQGTREPPILTRVTFYTESDLQAAADELWEVFLAMQYLWANRVRRQMADAELESLLAEFRKGAAMEKQPDNLDGDHP
jgi:hypothetical protein